MISPGFVDELHYSELDKNYRTMIKERQYKLLDNVVFKILLEF